MIPQFNYLTVDEFVVTETSVNAWKSYDATLLDSEAEIGVIEIEAEVNFHAGGIQVIRYDVNLRYCEVTFAEMEPQSLAAMTGDDGGGAFVFQSQNQGTGCAKTSLSVGQNDDLGLVRRRL